MHLPRIALCFATACLAPLAAAQNFPSKPIRIITANAAGGSDVIARVTAQALSTNFGQPAVVVNHPGTTIVAVMEVVKAAPDGYTLLSLAKQFWLLPYLMDDIPYDPEKDLAPVTMTASSPNMFVVHTSVPATSIKELIALAKAKPGVLNYGIGNYGGSPHLAGELFKAMSQTDIVVVPYKSTGAALTALMAGQIQLTIPTISSGMPGVKAGKLRALAVTTDKPTALAPGIPTVSDAGLPGYESSSGFVVFAPAKTPANVVGTLNQAIVKYLQTPDIKEKMAGAGLEIVANSPQELAGAMKRDRERMGKVIRDAGIRGAD